MDYVNDVYPSKTIHPSSMARYNYLPAFPNIDLTLMEGHLLANVPRKNDPHRRLLVHRTLLLLLD